MKKLNFENNLEGFKIFLMELQWKLFFIFVIKKYKLKYFKNFLTELPFLSSPLILFVANY